jgi:hypothetical protein
MISVVCHFWLNITLSAGQSMHRNALYLIISLRAVAAVVFGYQLYQERQKTTGIEINVGKSGISVEKK